MNYFVKWHGDQRKFVWYKLYAFVVGRAYDAFGEPTLDYHFSSYCVYSHRAWKEVLNERFGLLK